MKRFFLFLFIFCCRLSASGQSFSNDTSGTTLFMYEVKQIDEFIERFNDEKNSFIRQEYRKKKKEAAISRNQLVLRLFNTERTDWDYDLIKSFLYQVLDPKKPQYLNFLDSNWYAEANCVFKAKDSVYFIPLTLQIKNTNPKGARWMIAGAADHAAIENMPSVAVPDKGKDDFHFIASSSHANNFIGLHRALEDKDNLNDFLDPHFANTVYGRKFLQAVYHDKLQLLYVKSVKFHFCQVDNWVFTVERFKRQTMNQGWLINELKKLTRSEKEFYKNKLLFRNDKES